MRWPRLRRRHAGTAVACESVVKATGVAMEEHVACGMSLQPWHWLLSLMSAHGCISALSTLRMKSTIKARWHHGTGGAGAGPIPVALDDHPSRPSSA